MTEPSYISVIIPLKLEWEPCYRLPDSIDPGSVAIGDRVKVRFANRMYSGVVSATDVRPETDESKIKDIEEIEQGLERILLQEIELWRKVADYYLCTIGEVYKAAYPVGKINLEEAHAAAVAKAAQRKEKVLESMRQKVARLEERLSKKDALIQKSKDGTKTKAKLSEDSERIRHEIAIAREALAKAEACQGRDADVPAGSISTDKIVLSDAQQNKAR